MNSVDSLRLEAFSELVREHQAGLRAFVRALGDCIGKLPERKRDLLRKRYEADQNASVLSSLFQMRPDAIRQSLTRIVAWVKQCIETQTGVAMNEERYQELLGRLLDDELDFAQLVWDWKVRWPLP